MKIFHRFLIAGGLLGALPVGAIAQTDTLRLSTLISDAARVDPREAQIRLLRLQSDLRMKNLNSSRLPSVSLDSYAQYQSDVARIPVTLPGFSIPTPPHDTYDARLIAQQSIFDPTLNARRDVERAQLADAESRVRSSIYTLRKSLIESYFAALSAQERMAEIETSITDLKAQLVVASARVREGTALPSEEHAIRAELLRREQILDDSRAAKLSATITVFGLTGRFAVFDPVVFTLPDSASVPYPPVPELLRPLKARPEFESFRTSRELLARQQNARAAQDRPRLSAYARAGFGRPGLNPLANRWDSYWLAGVQLQWSLLNWGSSARDREILDLQSRIVQTEEDTFLQAVNRETAQPYARIQALISGLAKDEEIIALRGKIMAETAAKYREGAVTSDVYVDKQTDVLAARVARAMHRVELMAEKVRIVNTLGLEIK